MRALAAIVLGAGFLMAAAGPASAGGRERDSIVQSGGPFAGYQVINETGQGQTLTKSVKVGKAASFVWIVYNDTDIGGQVTFTGSGSNQCFRVRYFGVNGTDITDSVLAGRVTTMEFLSMSFPMQVEIKAKSCATSGSTRTVNLDASRGGTFDRARAKVKVK